MEENESLYPSMPLMIPITALPQLRQGWIPLSLVMKIKEPAIGK